MVEQAKKGNIGHEQPDDDALMTLIAQGEMAMLGQLYMRHSKLVKGAVRRIAPAIPDAQLEELTHDVFMLLCRKAKTYDNRGKFKSYLYGIAVRKARTWQRNTWLRRNLLGKHLPVIANVNPSPADKYALRETVSQVLSRLPEKQRSVLLLHAVEGFSGDEIAQILGVSAKTVRSRIFRARKTLLDNVNRDSWVQALQKESL